MFGCHGTLLISAPPEHVAALLVRPGQSSIMRRKYRLASLSRASARSGRDFVCRPAWAGIRLPRCGGRAELNWPRRLTFPGLKTEHCLSSAIPPGCSNQPDFRAHFGNRPSGGLGIEHIRAPDVLVPHGPAPPMAFWTCCVPRITPSRSPASRTIVSQSLVRISCECAKLFRRLSKALQPSSTCRRDVNRVSRRIVSLRAMIWLCRRTAGSR